MRLSYIILIIKKKKRGYRTVIFTNHKTDQKISRIPLDVCLISIVMPEKDACLVLDYLLPLHLSNIINLSLSLKIWTNNNTAELLKVRLVFGCSN